MGDITVRLRRGRNAPAAARPTVQTANRLVREGQPDEAAKIYKACLAANPRDLGAWIELGRLCVAQRRSVGALNAFNQALRLSPNDSELLKIVGRNLIRLGDLERAAQIFGRLAAVAPHDFEGYAFKSAVERNIGQPERSRRTLKEGIARARSTVLPSFLPPLCRILQLQGLENSYYDLSQDRRGSPQTVLQRGNFAAEHFWTSRQFETIVWRITGDEIADGGSLPPHDVIVNSIADADVEAASLRNLARFLKGVSHAPVINDPNRVPETTRDRNYRRLKDVPGIIFPKTVRWHRERDGGFEAFLAGEGLSFPVILRIPGTHTGTSTAKVDDAAAAAAYFENNAGEEFYVIEFIECRYRRDFYRKMRMFFIDGELYPVVHHIDPYWNVHGFNRPEIMANNSWMMDVERSYVSDPVAFLGAEVHERLKSLYKLVGLDFFGVDFTATDDGDILIYEMNAVMRHSFDHAKIFPYLRPSLRRITRAFQAMLLSRCGRT